MALAIRSLLLEYTVEIFSGEILKNRSCANQLLMQMDVICIHIKFGELMYNFSSKREEIDRKLYLTDMLPCLFCIFPRFVNFNARMENSEYLV